MQLIGTSTSYAGWFDGNDLKNSCSSNESYKQGFCLGFIAASTEVAANTYFCEFTIGGRELLKISAYDECENQKQIATPSKMKLGQAKDIVVKFLNDNPAELHRSADSLVSQAIFKAFGLRKVEP